MPKRSTPWPNGVPCWVDLTVPDVLAAQAFYSAVLGWAFPDPDEDTGGYAIARVDGAATAGIGPPRSPASRRRGRSTWPPTTRTRPPPRSARPAARCCCPPGDVGPLGRLFVAADPTGAVFGGWQAGRHPGAELHSEPGGLVWEDLRSPDPDTARAFYTAVFGYRTEPLEMAGPDYTTFGLPGGGDAPLGGMGGMFGAPAGTPAHWLVYFGVHDTDAALAAGAAAGGTLTADPHDSPFGRMGYLRDPFGADFVVMTTDATPPPPER
jgi:predicted enzyme related to lactoylglutathione lyase